MFLRILQGREGLPLLIVLLFGVCAAELFVCVCNCSLNSNDACTGFANGNGPCNSSGNPYREYSTCDPITGFRLCATNRANLSCEKSSEGGCGDFCDKVYYVTSGNIDPNCPGQTKDCFPSFATVELENGELRKMSEIQIGDSVLVSSGQYSRVYMFSHRHENAQALFVVIKSHHVTLHLTPAHYIYVDDVLTIAGLVKVGDNITLRDGTKVQVTSVSREWATGLFNPHTMHGDIVVNGVKTSTYTQGIAPSLAHAALWPIRLLYAAGIQIDKSTFAYGSQMIAALMPNGEPRY